MVKLYKEQKNSIYKLQKLCGLGKDTLYKYARGYRKIENMPVNIILKISHYEKINPNELIEKMIEYEKLK